jgi:hypothetical protein
MSTSDSEKFYRIDRSHAKRVAKKVLQWHLPVGRGNRLLFGTLYGIHVAARVAAELSFRFFWYEPLFRSQCKKIGDRFRMEQLPYLLGRGEIVIGNDVRLSGKPSFVFSSRYTQTPGGNPEVVDHGKTGPLVPAQDPQALAQAMSRVHRQPKLGREMGLCGRSRVEAEFSVQRMIREYEEYYLDEAPR